MGDIKRNRPQHITAKQIIDKTARYYNIDVKICAHPDETNFAMPRQIAMFLLRSELKMSFPEIAQELGRKDHTTAMHSIEKITKESLIKCQYSRVKLTTLRINYMFINCSSRCCVLRSSQHTQICGKKTTSQQTVE